MSKIIITINLEKIPKIMANGIAIEIKKQLQGQMKEAGISPDNLTVETSG